jgi:predicted RNA-binding Zn ribbon-like protein
MKAAPIAARTAGLPNPDGLAFAPGAALPSPAPVASLLARPVSATPGPLAVSTVSSYGTDMSPTLDGHADSSQSHFDADQLEAMAGCAELINSGRSGAGELLPDLASVQSFADRYAFHGVPAQPADLPLLRRHRGRLDEIARACEAGDIDSAIDQLNTLLARTGASPQIAAHDGRGPHIHVSRPESPLANRMAAHFAMGLAWLVVAGQASRVHSCESPTCDEVFVDMSRNRSRRYCDSKTCGNRLHVAAYRARRQATASLPDGYFLTRTDAQFLGYSCGSVP